MTANQAPNPNDKDIASQTVAVSGGQTAEVVGDRSAEPPELHVHASGECWSYHIKNGTAILVDATYGEEPSWMPDLLRQVGVDPQEDQ